MKGVVAFLIGFLFMMQALQVQAATLTTCTGSGVKQTLGDTLEGTWLCSSYVPQGQTSVTYVMSVSKPVLMFFQPGATFSYPYTLQITCDSSFSYTVGNGNSGFTTPVKVGPCSALTMSLQVPTYYGYSLGFELTWTELFVDPLPPGINLPYNVVSRPNGALVYYYFSESAGSEFYVNVTVNNYNGFIAPQLIAATNYMPLPGGQDTTVTLHQNAVQYVGSLELSPSGSNYGFGVELFGNVANSYIYMEATWRYNYPSVANGEKFFSSQGNYFQAMVGTSPTINVQVARTNTGGYPEFIVYAGSPNSGPQVANLTTTANNYDSVSFNNPWFSGQNPNPGLIIIVASCQIQSSCGFTGAVSW